MYKELVVISGKGGTGKSTIVSALATFASDKIVVDCDVDAADLFLIFQPIIKSKTEFYSGKTAKIDASKCVECGECSKICKYEAINNYKIDPLLCEGCGACFYKCHKKAIHLVDKKTGDWFVSSSRFGTFIHAKLGIGEDNSGKLISQIKSKARDLAESNSDKLILIDGSPGIGCQVIASISGADLCLLITEPTLSGLHDAQRVIELTKHFHIKCIVCINKYDINIDMAEKMVDFFTKNDIDVVGKIPYSSDVSKAMGAGKSIIEFSKDSIVSKKIFDIWTQIQKNLK